MAQRDQIQRIRWHMNAVHGQKYSASSRIRNHICAEHIDHLSFFQTLRFFNIRKK